MAGWIASSALIVALLILAPLIGLFSQPWAGFWFGQHVTAAPVDVGNIPLGDSLPRQQPAPGPAPVVPSGFVSDIDRARLAVAAGFTELDIAVAISLAENGSGDPTALSAPNFDGSRDLGLWQINSGWWPQFGGQQALTVPINNARAAYAIYQRQGWCAWSTYNASCGRGHNGAYIPLLPRARVAVAEARR